MTAVLTLIGLGLNGIGGTILISNAVLRVRRCARESAILRAKLERPA